jgi:hypothetical protein
MPSAAIGQVTKWILAGQSHADIAEAITATFPEADGEALITEALRNMAKAGDDPAAILGFCIEASRELYRRTLEIGDHATALRAVAQLHRLAKVAPSRKQTQEDDDTTLSILDVG